MGQTITVDGKGVSPYRFLRIDWWLGDSTQDVTILDLTTSPDCSLEVTVPAEAVLADNSYPFDSLLIRTNHAGGIPADSWFFRRT